MTNISYISYVCKDEKIIKFSLVITKKEDIEVYINNILIDPNNYVVNNIGFDNQNITFVENIGEKDNPSILTIILIADIKRQTKFQNQSQISAHHLNLELDNIIKNQSILYKLLKHSIKSTFETKYNVFLPNPQQDKILCWDKNGNIVNSDKNINYIIENIDDLKHRLNNFDKNYFPNVKENISLPDSENKSIVKNPNTSDEITVFSCDKIIYKNPNMKNVVNASEAFEFLYNSFRTLQNVQESFNTKILALRQNESSLISKIQELEVKSQHITSNNNEQYITLCHAIISAKTNMQGYTDFLSNTSKPYELILTASAETPFIVSFSNNRQTIIKKIEQNLFLNAKMTTEILYIYLELQEDNNIILGCTENKPLYLYSFPNINNSMFILDKYNFKGDYFHIPSLTMYTNSNKSVNRIYIGQVAFDETGNYLSFCNNFALGNSIVFDVNIANKIDTMVKFNNPFGVENLLHNIYLKSSIRTVTEAKNNYVPLNIVYREDGVGNVLHYGVNLSISNTNIECITGKRFIQTIASLSSKFKRSTNEVILRMILNRGF